MAEEINFKSEKLTFLQVRGSPGIAECCSMPFLSWNLTFHRFHMMYNFKFYVQILM